MGEARLPPRPRPGSQGGAEPWSGPCKLKTIFSFCKSALASAQPPVAALAKLAEISARRCGLAGGLVPRSHVVAGLPAACCLLSVNGNDHVDVDDADFNYSYSANCDGDDDGDGDCSPTFA